MMLTYRHIRMICALGLALSIIAGNTVGSTLNPSLRGLQSNVANSDSVVEILLFLDNSESQHSLSSIGGDRFVSRSERIRKVNQSLRSFRHPSADQIESILNQHAVGAVGKFWIIPAYSLKVRVSSLLELSSLPEVFSITENARVVYEPPTASSVALATSIGPSAELQSMNIPAVWSKGYTGAGRLVCSFDTGVDGVHPALWPKWRGQSSTLEEAWFSKVRPDGPPTDLVGHGTHTMGVMVGSDGADSFGVAPDAQWIAAGVIDQGKSLEATFADILEAYQWALNPDGDLGTTEDVPDVILNSWGVPAGMFEPCDDLFWGAIDAIESAGIVTIFAAGNEGPDPSTIRSPADRASTPLNSFSVGAVDPSLTIAGFSSHGPSSCDPSQIKPEVVAPGVQIRSSTKGGGYISMSGTSMAAPYIAGLVALARQYNPDATPTQIKQAMIFAAQDLGVAGEDNSYGYGFVDAAKMLDYLPDPINPDYRLEETIVSSGQRPMPGDTAQLQVLLVNDLGIDSGLYGRLHTNGVTQVELLTEYVALQELDDGLRVVTSVPFVLLCDTAMPHGTQVSLDMSIETSEGEILGSVDLSFLVGIDPPGQIETHATGAITLSVSDYGQLGLGVGSIYNAGGEGIRFHGSDNLLYEAGILIGRSGYDLSSAIRGADGGFEPSDFSPTQAVATEFSSSSNESRLSARFTDTVNEQSLPIDVGLTSIDLSGDYQETIILLSYQLVNRGSAVLDSVYFGFEADFDLFGETETLSYSDSLNMIYQLSSSSPAVGIVMINNLTSASVLLNGKGKAGLKDSEKLSLISSPDIRLEAPIADDLFFILGSPALTIGPDDTANIVLALVIGADPQELEAMGQLAIEHSQRLGLGDFDGSLPDKFVLDQNYPNPFNPSTTIAFSLLEPSSVSLELYNVLGQVVATLYQGDLAAGIHEFIWDSRNRNGHEVASGLYFYRLSVGSESRAKKMVLLR